MAKPPGSSDRWDATWEGARARAVEAALDATPQQRLAWLEEVLELAYRSGALDTHPSLRRS
jgi:hypothetical protein